MKAVAYCRYSTDNQDDNSIAYQMEAIQKHCAAKGHTLINIYTDEAQSGTNLNRDGFKRMISDAEKNTFDTVIIYDQSRLSRNIVDWFTLRERFRTLSIKLESCTENISEVDDPSSFLSESMKAIISQHFVMETRKKVIAGQASKAKEGVFLGGIAPLGYDIDQSNYVINHYEAGAVRLIFELYANGYGYKHICNELKREGYKSKRGAEIGANAIKPILQNERYIGVYFWNKRLVKYFGKYAGNGYNPEVVRIENRIPAIIEYELWERVKNRMKNTEVKIKQGQSKLEYLLSGLIRCDKCGSAFTGFYRSNSRGYKHRYYGRSRKINKKGCDCKNINADDLEILIVTLLKDEFFNTNLIERTAEMIIEKAESGMKDVTSKAGELKKQISDTSNKISNLLNAMEQGVVNQSLKDRLTDLEKEKSLLEQTLSVLNLSDDKCIDKAALVKQLKRDSFDLHNELEKLKEILKKYIAKIVISDETVEISAFGDINSVRYSGRGI